MISARNLRVVYKPARLEAVRDVHFEIPENKVTCILGPNASGKTTILRAIAYLVDYEGSVLIEGREVKNIVNVLRRILSYTPSISTSGDFLGTRVINVLLYSRYPVSRGFFETNADLEEVYRVARILRIEHLLDRRLGELSSGELQRVVLACALVKNPRVILLDEPDSHLDVSFKSWLSSFLKELSKQVTIVLSTHDTVFATSTCDYVILVSKGRVVYRGPTKELFASLEVLEEVYGAKFAVAKFGDREVLIPVYGDTSSFSQS